MSEKQFSTDNFTDAEDTDVSRHLPIAPEVDPLDEDDGIFMSWPGAEDEEEENEPFSSDFPPEDDGDLSPDDDPFSKKDPPTPKKEKKKKKKTVNRKSKGKSADTDTPEDEHAQYTFRRAARSDMEESSGKKPKKPKHNEADNEATLASIKYYKYTRKLKQLVVHRFLPLAMAFVLIVGFVLYFFRLQHLNFVNLTGYAAEDVFAATGIKKNAFVFSVSSSDIEKRLRTKFPYIQSVSVELDLPDTVSLVFEEDCALFYTQIYDEYFVVSESMRVLARYDTTDELDAGLRAVTLPAVSYAVVGHSLQFFDSSYLTFLKEFLAVLEISDIYDRITSMDLSNRFDILVTYEDRLDIYLGDDEYLESNLSFAKSIIEGLKDNDAGDITIIDNKTASFSAVSTR